VFPEEFLPDGKLEIVAVELDSVEATMQLRLRSRASHGICPSCGQPSQSIHSGYERTLKDLPCSGFAIRIILEVRRFFCKAVACTRKTFSERLPEVTQPYARQTNRLSGLVQTLALLVGSSMGKRLLGQLGIPTSIWSMLRLLRKVDIAGRPTPRILGVDDWAMRRGRRYGTILVDLESSKVVDLLPGREANTLASWLMTHPGVEVISRDRAEAYAEGARLGAPNAVQVADRWHLLKNLGDMLVRVLSSHPRELKRLAQQVDPSSPTDFPSESSPEQLPMVSAPAKRNAPRRYQRFVEVHTLHEQGFHITAIARQTGLDRKTVRKYLAYTTLPEVRRVPYHRSRKLAPYEAYLLDHCEYGRRTVRQLYGDIQAQGYGGCLTAVAAFMSQVRKERGLLPFVPTDVLLSNTPYPYAQLSPRTAAWLLLAQPKDLTPNEQTLAAALPKLHPDIELAAHAAQRFTELVRSRAFERFDAWLNDMHQSTLPQLRSFARSIQRDYAAVRAALTLPWSNGPVEGHVNLLKFIKRQMFGRANFDLLRRRVLAFSA